MLSPRTLFTSILEDWTITKGTLAVVIQLDSVTVPLQKFQPVLLHKIRARPQLAEGI